MRHIVPISGKDSLATAIVVNKWRESCGDLDRFVELVKVLGVNISILSDFESMPAINHNDTIEYIYI